ncbi:hypothetical protein MNBD_UNCLBAC01-1830 [hydrothermal vent metagenome]|uniref:GGDEF domain-containing protein n=1 Tax=hydrothermal vent metagenome TaxID=652676 RepID=A0A3B1DDK0_9ZZZZ
MSGYTLTVTLEQSKSTYHSSLPWMLGLFGLLIFFFLGAVFIDFNIFIFLGAGLLVLIFYLIRLHHHLSDKKNESGLKMEKHHEKINLLVSEIEQKELAIQSFREKIINFKQLKGVTECLSLCLHPEETSSVLSKEVNSLFGDEETTVILYLFHSKTGELGISSSQKGQMRVNIKSKKGDIFDRWVVKGMQSLVVKDTRSDYRFDADKVVTDDDRPIRSLVSVPLMVGNKALGILRVDSPRENRFSMEDLRFLTTIGDLGALAIENAQLYERVEQLAIRDGLTGLYLRKYFLDRVPMEISRQLRHDSSLSFLMIDLDKFKRYNDKFGHVAGDIVLRTVSMVLANFFKEPGDLVCRYGGEEFSVLLPDCSKEKAMVLARQVRKKIEAQNIILRREKTHVTISIGVASYPKDGHNLEELIYRADMALYRAKNNGRNRVEAA